MTELLKQAFDRLRALPPDVQDRYARLLLSFIESGAMSDQAADLSEAELARLMAGDANHAKIA